ncbi:unnamed protein product [Nesidiocoris tenuis]|uniref:Uncharacterized protein n=1 Tax=Nesidiocoris tenuis TaxID=355587 RepID=A0A6H5FUJ9_9HEMI|nr:unnamed protein product [Nesidiocoris tenuis]
MYFLEGGQLRFRRPENVPENSPDNDSIRTRSSYVVKVVPSISICGKMVTVETVELTSLLNTERWKAKKRRPRLADGPASSGRRRRWRSRRRYEEVETVAEAPAQRHASPPGWGKRYISRDDAWRTTFRPSKRGQCALQAPEVPTAIEFEKKFFYI